VVTSIAPVLLLVFSPSVVSQPLPEEIVDLVESGVSILVGTRDGELRPASVRGVGAQVSPDRRKVTVFLPEATAAKAARNLRDNGEIAVAFSRPIDNLAVQIKGRCHELRRAAEGERPIPERYGVAFVEMTYAVGMPRSLMKRMTVWPAWAASFEVREVYSQTPGPGAGKVWGSR
jgi:hypothetical protein